MAQRSSGKTRDLSRLVLVISLPGALLLGSIGFCLGMLAIFMGGLPPYHPEVICTFFWGVFGGGCLGATPGLVAGWYWGLKWVRPFLGAAVGALLSVLRIVLIDVGLLEAMFEVGLLERPDLGRRGNDLGAPIDVTLVMLGLIIGIGTLFLVSRHKTELFKERPPIG
ncbi:MAG: hypothetical protein H7062_05340 [Candidatus Saccharimonas sp.]|nr:hypothetical protein [Planctomycetaceae bacterium]